jgi:hypothetical protein
MCWYGSASGKRGCSPKYSEAAIQFCLTIKCLFNLPLRQAMGMAQSLLELAGLDWRVPDFSTVSRRQKHLAVTIGAQPTTGLYLLVDSTSIKMLGEGEWKTKKHGADYRRQWRKVHLDIDAATLEIRAIEVTDNATGDAPMLPCLLDQLPAEETIASISGDGAYDTKGCHEAVAHRSAQAIIPDSQECQAVEGLASWRQSPQCHPGGHAPVGPQDLEEVERIPSAQPCRDQDALLQAAR